MSKGPELGVSGRIAGRLRHALGFRFVSGNPRRDCCSTMSTHSESKAAISELFSASALANAACMRSCRLAACDTSFISASRQ